MKKPPRTLTRQARRTAWLVALAADIIQFVAMPIFGEGWASPLDDVLDLVVGIVLVRLLGWHPALLPALIAELVPGVDLMPSWTLAVAVATWGRKEELSQGDASASSTPPAGSPPPGAGLPPSHAEVLDDEPPR